MHLNKVFTEDLSPDELKALFLECADWRPGPVFVQPGSKVSLKSKDFKHLKGRVGRVIEHLAEDPRIVTLFIAADQEFSGSGSD